MAFCLETIEYEAQLKHQNEMKKLEAELKGKYVPTKSRTYILIKISFVMLGIVARTISFCYC